MSKSNAFEIHPPARPEPPLGLLPSPILRGLSSVSRGSATAPQQPLPPTEQHLCPSTRGGERPLVGPARRTPGCFGECTPAQNSV
jgi:hypothetical protein